ncbi:hypothetical protein [Echinicola strongylocentroti]|nr:hypothetical protein [Echinicola strongylocentroti]
MIYTRKDARNGNAKARSILSGKNTGKYDYSHHITEEDYAQAEDCGEDCY